MAKTKTPPTKSVKIEIAAIEKLKTWCDKHGKRLTWELSRAAERACAPDEDRGGPARA